MDRSHRSLRKGYRYSRSRSPKNRQTQFRYKKTDDRSPNRQSRQEKHHRRDRERSRERDGSSKMDIAPPVRRPHDRRNDFRQERTDRFTNRRPIRKQWETKKGGQFRGNFRDSRRSPQRWAHDRHNEEELNTMYDDRSSKRIVDLRAYREEQDRKAAEKKAEEEK